MSGVPAVLGLVAASLCFAGPADAAAATAGKALVMKTCANCHSTEAGVNKVAYLSLLK